VELQNFQADFQQLWVIKLSPNGDFLATGGKTGILKIFEILGTNYKNYKESYTSQDVQSYLKFMSETPLRCYNIHSDDIIDICWSPRVRKIYLIYHIFPLLGSQSITYRKSRLFRNNVEHRLRKSNSEVPSLLNCDRRIFLPSKRTRQ
jgi:hypothetical protein